MQSHRRKEEEDEDQMAIEREEMRSSDEQR